MKKLPSKVIKTNVEIMGQILSEALHEAVKVQEEEPMGVICYIVGTPASDSDERYTALHCNMHPEVAIEALLNLLTSMIQDHEDSLKKFEDANKRTTPDDILGDIMKRFH